MAVSKDREDFVSLMKNASRTVIALAGPRGRGADERSLMQHISSLDIDLQCYIE